ncbi:MAG: competence/damage-inducible protein A [Acidobacteria bacterium]|nr:competence/damage-inducible protein A [Acidobacteriota bacterium]
MSRPLSAAILAVGSEMLTPSRVDTNSLYVTQVLNGLGIGVAYKAVVGDDRDELAAQIRHALGRVPILVLTGGLGPTDDDLTREVVAEVLGRSLLEQAELVETIRARFATRGLPMPDVNRRQAMVPEGATVLDNPNGSAPGLLIEHDGALIALLPGPPREMRPMLDGAVRTRLVAMAGSTRLLRRVMRVAGRTESRVEERVQPVYRAWLDATPRIETTILAAPGLIELHLTTQVDDEAAGWEALARAVAEIDGVLGGDVVSTNDVTLEAVVGQMLRQRGWRIALAESCTGGLVTSRLTDVPGSSAYVDRSFVVYSNAAKTDMLGVPAEMIARHGAVSQEVARAMAEGALARAGVDMAIAITGIAGPDGGSDEKPVGTVWIAVATNQPPRTQAAVCRFLGGREFVKMFSALTALDLARRHILDLPWDVDWIRR